MLTFEEACYFFSYNQVTGELRWKNRLPSSRTPLNSIAGTSLVGNRTSYIRVCIGGKKILAHRIVFLIMTGDWPSKDIDHIDGNGTNNAWSNLREVNRTENCKNRRRPLNNTSGHVGVTWNIRDKVWNASIKINQTNKHIGNFKYIEDAITARKKAEAQHNFYPLHGKD